MATILSQEVFPIVAWFFFFFWTLGIRVCVSWLVILFMGYSLALQRTIRELQTSQMVGGSQAIRKMNLASFII